MSLPEIGSIVENDHITEVWTIKITEHVDVTNEFSQPDKAARYDILSYVERSEYDLEYKVKKVQEITDYLNSIAKNLCLEDIKKLDELVGSFLHFGFNSHNLANETYDIYF